MSVIFPIRPQSDDVIRKYLKGCSVNAAGFQGIALLQILISIKFPFQQYII